MSSRCSQGTKGPRDQGTKGPPVFPESLQTLSSPLQRSNTNTRASGRRHVFRPGPWVLCDRGGCRCIVAPRNREWRAVPNALIYLTETAKQGISNDSSCFSQWSTSKNAVLLGVTPRGSCKNRVSEELSVSIIFHTSFLSHFEFLSSVCRFLVRANVVPSSPILVTLMMEALSSSETSFLTRTTRRSIPEDAILHSHRRVNLKYYITFTSWTL
jgi:hypothetical protein